MTATESPSAEENVVRPITAATGAAGLILLLTSLSDVFTAAPQLNLGYAIGAPLLVIGGFSALIVITFTVRLPQIRRAQGCFALVYLLAVLAWLPALVEIPMSVGVNPWVLEISTLGTIPAVIAWKPAVAWLYLVAISALNVPIRYLSTGDGNWAAPHQHALLTITLGGVFAALAMAAIHNARAVDAATTVLRNATASSAAAAARAQEQARLDALVHDEVMSTLLYASAGEPGLEPSVRRQAKHTLAQLERLRTGRNENPVPPGVFAARLRSVVLAASVEIDFEVSGTRSASIPGLVAAAFAEATAEATRNTLKHAPNALRAVRVHLSETVVQVEVRDSGPGFDPAEIDPRRLGITVSIRGRMATLSGGHAMVESGTDRGTVVSLEWSDK